MPRKWFCTNKVVSKWMDLASHWYFVLMEGDEGVFYLTVRNSNGIKVGTILL